MIYAFKSQTIDEAYNECNNSINQIWIDFAFNDSLYVNESDGNNEGIKEKIFNTFKKILQRVLKFFTTLKEKISDTIAKIKLKIFKKQINSSTDDSKKDDSNIKEMNPEEAKSKWPSPEKANVIDYKAGFIMEDYANKIENLNVDRYLDISNADSITNDNDLGKIKMIGSDAEKIYNRMSNGKFDKEIDLKNDDVKDLGAKLLELGEKSQKLINYKHNNIQKLIKKYDSMDASRLLPGPDVNSEAIGIMNQVTRQVLVSYTIVQKGIMKIIENNMPVVNKYRNLIAQGYPY